MSETPFLGEGVTVIHIGYDKDNIIKNCSCPRCGCRFSCTSDLASHRKYVKCKPKKGSNVDSLQWTPFKNGNGEWTFSENSSYLKSYIVQGNRTIGEYDYWLYGNNKFIGRRRKNGTR